MSDMYEFLKIDNIATYLKSHKEISTVIDAESIVEINEVGDGNLNFVFIIKDKNGDGIVLKQALPYVRLVGPSWPMSPDRARIEYETTKAHSLAAKNLVPEIYFYDPARFIIAMEDLSDHTVWRTSLNQGERNYGVAAAIGEYIARTLFATSIFGSGADGHYKGVAHAINPELCLITEDLVFTEPFYPADRNSYLPENREDAEAVINDRQMVLEIGQLKYKFMTSAEALLHGDLHTGSVMVKSDLAGTAISTKAFDSEFSFYGPIGFDIGACFANLYIALARATALGRNEQADFVAELPEELWCSFEKHFRSLWPSRADKRVFSDQFLEEQMTQWKIDAVGFASAKMVRRIVGLAKTSDIETLEPQLRIGAARGILRSAQMAIRERHSNIDLTLLTKKIREILEETRTS